MQQWLGKCFRGGCHVFFCTNVESFCDLWSKNPDFSENLFSDTNQSLINLNSIDLDLDLWREISNAPFYDLDLWGGISKSLFYDLDLCGEISKSLISDLYLWGEISKSLISDLYLWGKFSKSLFYDLNLWGEISKSLFYDLDLCTLCGNFQFSDLWSWSLRGNFQISDLWSQSLRGNFQISDPWSRSLRENSKNVHVCCEYCLSHWLQAYLTHLCMYRFYVCMDWIWVTTWPWCVNCLSHWLQAFLTLSCLHLVWYHNPARVSNILSQSWHVNFASIDTTSVLHLLLYPISYISAAAPAARPRSSCATSLGLPKYFYIKILKYIPCINKYLVTWLTMC